MSQKNLIIVFVKNVLLGKVKTRLAASIGDYGAFEVYKHLVAITENQTDHLKNEVDIRIYFSDVIIDSKWQGCERFVQEGKTLGERMQNAFQTAFDDGYSTVIGVGSDLPDLTAELMKEGLKALNQKDTVFGPAKDGGYYLLGMREMIPWIFENKPWSTDKLLEVTLAELATKGISSTLLKELNDIDTIEDLKQSSINEKFKHLYELS